MLQKYLQNTYIVYITVPVGMLSLSVSVSVLHIASDIIIYIVAVKITTSETFPNNGIPLYLLTYCLYSCYRK